MQGLVLDLFEQRAVLERRRGVIRHAGQTADEIAARVDVCSRERGRDHAEEAPAARDRHDRGARHADHVEQAGDELVSRVAREHLRSRVLQDPGQHGRVGGGDGEALDRPLCVLRHADGGHELEHRSLVVPEQHADDVGIHDRRRRGCEAVGHLVAGAEIGERSAQSEQHVGSRVLPPGVFQGGGGLEGGRDVTRVRREESTLLRKEPGTLWVEGGEAPEPAAHRRHVDDESGAADVRHLRVQQLLRSRDGVLLGCEAIVVHAKGPIGRHPHGEEVLRRANREGGPP